jgi:hypothetical protein
MSVRAEKPLMLMLLPIVPPSAAPIVMPGTLRMADWNEVAPWLCISALLMMVIDCGMSITLPPTRWIETGGGAKSSLGRVPVTVTVLSVAGAPEGGAGWASGGVGLGSGAGPAGGGGAGCCAKAAGAMANPARTVFTGNRRFTTHSPSRSWDAANRPI